MARSKFRVALILDFITIEYSQRLFESVNEICKEYDVEKSQALSDITKIVANWKEIGLLL